MNKHELKVTAYKLRRVLAKYVTSEPNVIVLEAQLQDLLERAEQGHILHEVEISDIPGYKLLTETALQGYEDLSKAYAAFYIELTGGESDALKAFKARHAE